MKVTVPRGGCALRATVYLPGQVWATKDLTGFRNPSGLRLQRLHNLPGHRRLNSTMIYARVHDRTVAEDYYAAMAQIEKSLDLAAGQAPVWGTADTGAAMNAEERAQLLELLNQLAEPQLDPEIRVNLVEQIRRMLNREGAEWMENPAGGDSQQRGPP